MQTIDFAKREDRLSSWLDGEVKTFLFDSFSDDYCSRTGMDFLRGVEIPIKPQDLAAFHGEGGIPVTDLADNMALVIGANTQFKYRPQYITYMAMYFNEKLVEVLAQRGAAELKESRYRKACIYLRAALLLDGSNREAMFGYACCCREWYLSLEGEDEQELVGVLKQEASFFFEALTLQYPEYPAPHFFLGYVYINAGQYKKAQLAWRKFLQLAERSSKAAGESPEVFEEKEEIKEVRERLASLEDPVKIEAGINSLLSGRLEEGLAVLESYVGSSYDSWWPLHYYLACAYRELGFFEESIEGFLRVLSLNPSNADACEALADLYAAEGDAEKSEKYRTKAELVR